MDVIYTDSEGKDIGVLNAFTFDLAYGTEENTFALTLDAKIKECTAGSYVYVDRTEYGGIVDNITVDSKKGEIVYSGRTWHGILNSKVVQPDSGQDYYIVTGEANAIINTLLTRLGLTSLFKASSAISPVIINNYRFYRYCYAYDGLLAMLNDYNAKMLFSYDGDKVELSVVPAGDYTEFDYNTSEFEFTVEQYFKPINHLICLGQGELANRQVVHLYVDASRNISTTQTVFGADEVVGVYDYGNAKDIEELTKEGIKKLKELNNRDTVDIDFNSNDEVYDIGDLVGATDDTTGISVVQKITKKIVTIDDRGAIIKCKIDSGKYSKASLESGKESASAKEIYPIGAIYISTVETSPASLFGGTWNRLKDRFLIAAGDTFEAGSTGGSSSVTLTKDQLPSHTHTQQGSFTSGNPSANHYHGVSINTSNEAGRYSGGRGMYGVAYLQSQWMDTTGQQGLGRANNGAPWITATVDGRTHYHTVSGNTGTVSAWHTHTTTISGETKATGSGSAIDITNPYLAVYVWERVA
jgi:hypothetical protein